MKEEQGISRRSFLTTTAAAAVGPLILRSGILAAKGRPGANDLIGVGYIGVGRRAQQLMKLPPGMRIVAVNDLYKKRTDEFAGKLSCAGYPDYRELLADPHVDAIITATPDHWHAFITVESCKAGKDVYVEKPLTLTVKEGRQMVQAARKYKRIVQCGSQQRSMEACQQGCALVREGRIGTVHTVHADNYPSPWECDLPEQPVPEGLQWEVWHGQVEPRPFHNDLYLPRADGRKDAQGRPLGWISFRPYSGGEMTGWGAHGLDIVQWALGMDHTGPSEVAANARDLVSPVTFKYKNGITLHLDGKGPHGGGLFEGDLGTIMIDRGKYELRLKNGKTERSTQPSKMIEENNHLQQWEKAIRSRHLPNADVEIAHRSTTLCHLGNIARWLGRPLLWNPNKEKFRGDPEADTYLERSQRTPYGITL